MRDKERYKYMYMHKFIVCYKHVFIWYIIFHVVNIILNFFNTKKSSSCLWCTVLTFVNVFQNITILHDLKVILLCRLTINYKNRRVIRGFHIQDLSYTLCNVVRDTYSSLIIFVNYSPGSYQELLWTKIKVLKLQISGLIWCVLKRFSMIFYCRRNRLRHVFFK